MHLPVAHCSAASWRVALPPLHLPHQHAYIKCTAVPACICIRLQLCDNKSSWLVYSTGRTRLTSVILQTQPKHAASAHLCLSGAHRMATDASEHF